jgi:hypothetical protein
LSAHMAQHQILMLAAALLMILSRPLVPLPWGLPFDLRRVAWAGSQTRLRPVCLPIPHRSACGLDHPRRRASGLARTMALSGHPHERSCARRATRRLSLFPTPVQVGAVLRTRPVRAWNWGALRLHDRRPTGRPWRSAGALPFAVVCGLCGTGAGLGTHRLQEPGGLIMWVPAGAVYTIVGLGLLATWPRQSEAAMAGRSYAG